MALRHALDPSPPHRDGAFGGRASGALAGRRRATAAARVISLAGICDLMDYERLGNDCAASPAGLLGGTSLEFRSAALANPMGLLPLKALLPHSRESADAIVPVSQSENLPGWRAANCRLFGAAGHFDLVSPHSSAFEGYLADGAAEGGGGELTAWDEVKNSG